MPEAPHERTNHDTVPLDQLFGDEPESQPRRRWIGPLITTPLIALALWFYARVFGFGTPYELILAAVGSVRVLRWLLRRIPVVPVPPAMRGGAWEPEVPEPVAGEIDGLRRAVQRWEMRLGWSDRDAQRFGVAVRTRLVELIAERLRLRHGVILADEPERARALLGDELWAFLTAPVTRTFNPSEIAAVVARMEQT